MPRRGPICLGVGCVVAALVAMVGCGATGQGGAAHRDSARVRVGAVHDSSGTATTMAQRRVRVDTLTELMREGIAHTSMRDAELTSGGADAASYTVDATIERLQTLDQGSWMEVTCQLRLSLSDHRGKILAMFTKGAAVRSAKAEFGPAKEQALQRDVLAGTLRSLERDITRFLNNQPQRTK